MTETVLRLAARGDGVTDSGRFVALAAPGDQLLADGTILPGPHHQVPPCRHFPECGGCQLQQVDDPAYAGFLVDRVSGALAAQDIAATEIRTPHLSPPRTRRRASLRAERRGDTVRIGFNAEGKHRIVDMRECHILAPAIFDLVQPLRALLRVLIGPRDNAGVQMTLADQGVDLVIEGATADTLERSEALSAFAAAHVIARLSLDDGYGPQTLWEPQPVTITLSGVPVPLPHGAFLQATQDGEAALVAAVREVTGGATVSADLFAGLGTFALALPGKVYAAEGARDAALALTAAANRAQRQVFVEHRDLFRRPLTPVELGRFDAVVLDPPRAGAREQVAALAGAACRRLAYASCNPATFARDAAVLIGGGWRLDWVQPVGQFRWSTHVELVAAFAR